MIEFLGQSSATPSRVPATYPTPLVLLHFFGSSHREWTAWSKLASADRRVIAPDLPGFGDSADKPPADVTTMARDVEGSIVAAGIERCVIVGHSMSGKVAALLAARRSIDVRGLVLIAASPPSPEPMSEESRTRLLAFDGSRDAATEYIDGLTALPLPDDLREAAISDAMRSSLAAWKSWVVEGSQEDLSDVVGHPSLPTLIVVGSKDPSLGERVQREHVMPHFPAAELVVIAGGHALPIENPIELHRVIDRFLDRLESR